MATKIYVISCISSVRNRRLLPRYVRCSQRTRLRRDLYGGSSAAHRVVSGIGIGGISDAPFQSFAPVRAAVGRARCALHQNERRVLASGQTTGSVADIGELENEPRVGSWRFLSRKAKIYSFVACLGVGGRSCWVRRAAALLVSFGVAAGGKFLSFSAFVAGVV